MSTGFQLQEEQDAARLDLLREQARGLRLRNDALEGRQGVRVKERELAAAFTEWDRRYREEPERFQSEAEHLLRETPESYGEACAPYLLHILAELADRRPSTAGIDVRRDDVTCSCTPPLQSFGNLVIDPERVTSVVMKIRSTTNEWVGNVFDGEKWVETDVESARALGDYLLSLGINYRAKSMPPASQSFGG